MLVMDVKIDQAVQFGEYGAIKVLDKSGRRVRLGFVTNVPITLLANGIIPERFTTGITGHPRPHRPRILAAVQ